MRHFLLFLCGIPILFLFGCSDATFEPIEAEEPFVASVNIIEPSIQFIDKSHNTLALWTFNEAITGAELVGQELLVVYGHQLPYIKWISLSTGKVLKEQDIPVGTTNAYYDEFDNMVYITNNKTNRMYAYTVDGELLYELAMKNYPMSITADEQFIYVVNYKDTVLSVIDKKQQKVVNEWSIPKSSHGIYLTDNQVWIGGHGEGKEANRFIRVYANATGELVKLIELPIMPIGVTELNETIVVVSHGNSMIHAINQADEIIWEKQIGANPFAITTFKEELVVAGYDDHRIYFISENGEEIESISVGKGPFQLIIRR